MIASITKFRPVEKIVKNIDRLIRMDNQLNDQSVMIDRRYYEIVSAMKDAGTSSNKRKIIYSNYIRMDRRSYKKKYACWKKAKSVPRFEELYFKTVITWKINSINTNCCWRNSK